MHKTAYNHGLDFCKKYCSPLGDKIVLDVGSYDVNGTLKPIFEKAKQYIGLDQHAGPNVDITGSSHNIPLDNETIDIIVSSSCFEHDNMFWITFKEMCRVLKRDGLIYINAPSGGRYHAYPVDNWRFYKDSWSALCEWGKYCGYNLKLLESYVDPPNCRPGPDSVGIYRKI